MIHSCPSLTQWGPNPLVEMLNVYKNSTQDRFIRLPTFGFTSLLLISSCLTLGEFLHFLEIVFEHLINHLKYTLNDF